MRIGIDAHGVGGHSLGHGNETYFRYLIESLLELDADHEYHLFANHPEELEAVAAGRPNVQLVSLWPATQWIQRPISLPWYAARHGLDIVHTPFVRPPLSRARTVVTVHDVCFEDFPEHFTRLERWRMRALVPASCRRADRILTVSEYAKAQILRHYDVPPHKVVVTYNAAEHLRPAAGIAAPERPDGFASRPFIFYVGMIQSRKNLTRLVQAFEILRDRGLPHHLVLGGTMGWNTQALVAHVERSSHRDAIHFPGYIHHHTLGRWLAHADVFAFPSLFESFGIPPMEAQQWGTPAVVSDNTCFREIYRDSAEYCDAADPASIADAIARVIGDPTLRARLREAGHRNSARFSWQRTAELTLRTYEELGQERRAA